MNDVITRKAPWTDFNGDDLYAGDTIRHPSGEYGTIVYLADEQESVDQWRVNYGDPVLSRLCLQIGDNGQAVKVGKPR